MKWRLLGSIGFLHFQVLMILWLWGDAMSRSSLTSSAAASATRKQQHGTELETAPAKTVANTRDIVVIKWGGGLITDKSRLKTPLVEIMDMLAQTVLQCHNHDIDVIIVHGAGSYGHLRAKQWKLQEGYLPDVSFAAQASTECSSQEAAVLLVQRDMLELNAHVLAALRRANVTVRAFTPHLQGWTDSGPAFGGSLDSLALYMQAHRGYVAVTHGDVVPAGGARRFAVLSGDDIVVRLCLELHRARRLVFAVGGVDGLLKRPPEKGEEEGGGEGRSYEGEEEGEELLLAEWSTDVHFEGAHNAEIDVTGGIGLKAARGAYVKEAAAAQGREMDVLLVNGGMASRVAAACLGDKSVRGTRIVTSSFFSSVSATASPLASASFSEFASVSASASVSDSTSASSSVTVSVDSPEH